MTIIFGGRPNGLRMCRGCGCDDNPACVDARGNACAWVLLDFTIDVAGPAPHCDGSYWRPQLGQLSVEQLPTGVCSACADRIGWDMRELATMGIGDLDLGDAEEAA
jgi:hypothetical protein